MGLFIKVLAGTALLALGFILWAGGGVVSMIGGYYAPYTTEGGGVAALGGVIWFIGLLMIIGGFYVFYQAYKEYGRVGKQYLKEAIGEAIREERKVEAPQAVPSSGGARRFCTNCGTELSANVKYCPRCGQKSEA